MPGIEPTTCWATTETPQHFLMDFDLTCPFHSRFTPLCSLSPPPFWGVVFCLGPHPEAYGGSQAMGWIAAEVVAYATATLDPSCLCDIHHSSWQRWILNPLGKVRDQTWVSWMLVRFFSAQPWWELPLPTPPPFLILGPLNSIPALDYLVATIAQGTKFSFFCSWVEFILLFSISLFLCLLSLSLSHTHSSIL